MPYPSMSEVTSVMWCEYDDDDDDDDDGGGDDEIDGAKRTPTDGSGNNGRLLRVSVQTLDGHVCDDEDEDSETDDGDSETDEEDETDDDDDDSVERFSLTRSLRREQQGRRNASRGHTNGRTRGGLRQRGKGGRRASGVTRNKNGEEEFDDVECQRKEELASVLRRLRVAIRRMDGVLTEEKVRRGRYLRPSQLLHGGEM